MTQFDPVRPISMTKPTPAVDAGAPVTAVLPPAQLVPVGPPAGAPTGWGHPPVAPAPYGYPAPYPTAVVTQQSNAEMIVAWVFTGLTLLYMLPWAVAASRRSTNSILIAVATFFLAWTGIAWLVLLVLSFLGPTVHTVRPVVALAPVPVPPAGMWAHCPTDPPHVLRWWDGRAWTPHTSV